MNKVLHINKHTKTIYIEKDGKANHYTCNNLNVLNRVFTNDIVKANGRPFINEPKRYNKDTHIPVMIANNNWVLRDLPN